MRLFANPQGSCVTTLEGLIYGRPPGKLPRKLVGFLSVVQIRVEQPEPGLYRSTQIEAMTWLDLATRKPLGPWLNPYTGSTEIPVGFASPRNIYHFDTTGSYGAKLPPVRSGRLDLDWRTTGEDIWVTETRPNSFPSGITEAEFPRAYVSPTRESVDILTYRASQTDFRRPGFVSGQLNMLSDTPWPLWMMMGRRPGGGLWQGFGTKYRTLADVPAVNREIIDMAYPGFLLDPWKFPAAEWGTAAQLRRLKAQGKIR